MSSVDFGVPDFCFRRYRNGFLVLHHGEEIRIEGISDGEERAALDYVEVVPQPR